MHFIRNYIGGVSSKLNNGERAGRRNFRAANA